MREPLCLEIGGDGWCTAWAARWPGVHISRPSEAAAVAAMPKEISAYLGWLRRFGEAVPQPRRIDVEVTERLVFRARLHHGMTQAFFAIDRPAVTFREVRQQLRWLKHSRRTLLALVEGLPPEALLLGTPRRRGRRPGKGGGGWTIWHYLRHIAGTEKWYISQLWKGLPRLPRSESPFGRLALTRSQVLEVVRHPQREDLARSARSSGEMWTLRKVLRRLLYHERYHMRTTARILLAAGRPISQWTRSALGLPDLVLPLPESVIRWTPAMVQ